VGTTEEAKAEGEAARKRAAVEIVAHHEPALKRTARRYSLCVEDAEDAYQRALEILLTKAPTTDARELIRWTQTVTKHEALALRRSRERLLGRAAPVHSEEEGPVDLVALLPAEGDGPDEAAERREAIARSREALKALKPAELRALTLLAEGYSYAEIGEITGFSATKVNRSLAEGRERFRRLLAGSEDGSRCEELRPLLSAYCDGEAGAPDAAVLREHLRACVACRSTVRAYRATPRTVAGLVPALPFAQALLARLRKLFAGAKGTGMAKGLAICATAAGGAACVATGLVPVAFDSPSLGVAQPPREAAAFEAAPVSRLRSKPSQPRRKARPMGDRAKPADRGSGAERSPVAEYEAPPVPPPAPEPEPAPAPEAPPPAPPNEGEAPSPSNPAGEFGP
jgi:RNA polymerase sigma factor (sigma-70 family)